MSRTERGREVYGDQFGVSPAEAERQLVERFGAVFAEEAISAAGGAWHDEPLDRRERSLVVLAALVTQGGVEERLRGHVRFALANGVTPAQIEALVTLLTVYAGFPRASVAMEVVRSELARPGET